MLMNIETLQWDDYLCRWVPHTAVQTLLAAFNRQAHGLFG